MWNLSSTLVNFFSSIYVLGMNTVPLRFVAVPKGRRPKYSGDLIPVAAALARAGVPFIEIAAELDVHVSTISNWADRYPEFAAAVQAGKAAFDRRIENGLALKAAGYTKQTIKVVKTDDGTYEAIAYDEYVPPDTGAAIFWLKNRDPLAWRDKIELDGLIQHDVDLKVTGPEPTRELALAIINTILDGQREHAAAGEIIDAEANTEDTPAAEPAGRRVLPHAGAGDSGPDQTEGLAAPAPTLRRRRT